MKESKLNDLENDIHVNTNDEVKHEVHSHWNKKKLLL